MSVIKTEGLTYIYGENTPYVKTAVTDVNLTIEKPGLIGIIGHTGSGKSTLIQHFNGLVKPTSGRVLINDEDIWADPKKIKDIRFKVGLVFQYPEHQLFDATVERDIAFGPRNIGLSEQEISKCVREAAEAVGLKEELLAKSPFELSGGEKRRAAIAGVLAMHPEILILDEPTAGLDPKGRDVLLDCIIKYRQKSGSTVLLVSHSMEDIARICDSVIVMNHGKLEMFDTVDNVFRQVDRLVEMGLNVPQITDIMSKLKKAGLDVGDSILTVEKAKEQLLPLLTKGGAGRA